MPTTPTAEVSLQEEVEAAEADLRAMGLLATGLSHSLGTPLTSVMNNLVLIRRQLDREAGRSGEPEPLLDALARETEEALAGVDRLERVLRAMRDSFTVSPGVREPLRLDEAVGCALDAFERLDGGRHLIERDLAVVPPAPLNRAKVQRVALILLHNAAAFSPEGTRIRALVRPGHSSVEMSIEDEGCGVPREVADLIYEPFFTTRSEAVGLGLTMARAFVAVMGGSLWHESPRGGGARFVAWFPIDPPAAAEGDEEAAARTGGD